MDVLPTPTSRLPSIQQIKSRAPEDLSDALKYLRLIYNPEVRGSRRHRSDTSPRVDAAHQFDKCGVDELRSDAFERSYAIRWLTTLISQVETWDSELSDGNESSISLEQQREALVQDAASLLAICSGTAAAGIIVRDLVFTSSHEASGMLKIKLMDLPLDNRDYGSVGAQTWGGACVLAEEIVENPVRFGLLRGKMKNLRILELGAGTGLVSLIIGKLLASMSNICHATVVATDYYPSVLKNLEANIQSNFPFVNYTSELSDPCHQHVHISAHTLDWSSSCNEPSYGYPFDEPFDLIFGADIIYEEQHAQWIKGCLRQLLRKPDSVGSEPAFHLVIPLRRTHSIESGMIETIFSSQGLVQSDLCIQSKEIIVCDAGHGLGTDQIEYAYYVIGWR